MNREYHLWHSPNLGHEMELLVFGETGARVLVFPTRAGRFYDYEDWGLVDSVAAKIEEGWLQLYCVDSVDAESLYCEACSPRERIERHLHYEAYLLEEVLPFSWEKNPDTPLIVHGCSMGAFHAVNFAFRHPELVTKVVAFSGRYDLTRPLEDFRDLLDGHYDEDVYFNTPLHFLPNLEDEAILEQLRRLEIILVIGDADPFIGTNIELSEVLWQKDIPHELYIWEGRAHKARYWRQMAPLYL